MHSNANTAPSTTIMELRENHTKLTKLDMRIILGQATFMVERLYAHLILKRAKHGIDPVAMLQKLVDMMQHKPDSLVFNQSMEQVFGSLQDLHTQYIQPFPLRHMVAFLPFTLERYFDGNQWRYIVTRTKDDFDFGFGIGAEITHFNGVPLEQAILNNAASSGGGNPAAFFASGLYALTSRPLARTVIPDSDWVVITFLVNGSYRHIRIPWSIQLPPSGLNAPASPKPGVSTLSIHSKHLDIQKFNRLTYAKEKPLQKFQTKYPDQLEFGIKQTIYGSFGWLRIYSFSPPGGFKDFLTEVARIVQLLPPEGIIIDIRENPGGVIPVGESILQFFTDKEVVPEPLHFRATLETLALAEADESLTQWAPSIDQALETGDLYSAGFPLTKKELLTMFGRLYPGKSVLLTDALVYSTASFFTAGFQDNEIGPIICLDNNIGGGGANVWEHDDLAAVFPRTRIANPFEDMPNGTNISLALLQSSRVGKNSNIILSELGIKPDYRYLVGYRDLFEDFVDLFNFAGKVLAGKA